jgi:23S rRNA pseudouridine1911/1915/1917 synthase
MVLTEAILTVAFIYMPKISFVHPVTKDSLSIIAPVPQEVIWNAI